MSDETKIKVSKPYCLVFRIGFYLRAPKEMSR